MVKVILFQNEQAQFLGFQVLGHAGYADHGEDIVCAAISAVVQTTAIGIMERLQLPVDFAMDEGDLMLKMMQPNQDASLLIDTMCLGLESIASEYPNYIQIRNENGGKR